MSLNWKEINLVLDELKLPGCHVQGVFEPDYRTLVLEMYRPGEPFQFMISLAPQATRLHRATGKIAKQRATPRFAEFLRSRIRGCRIKNAEQLGEERIVRIDLEKADEQTVLWVRLWGGAANIIATEADGTILDAFFRRPSRSEMSGGHFDPAVGLAQAELKSAGAPRRQFTVRELPGDGDFNSRIEQEYRNRELAGEIVHLKERLTRYYADREERIQATIERLSNRAGEYALADQQKLCGDIIMSNLHRAVRGERWLVAENYADGGSEIRIPLDPSLSAVANAESYYDRYKRAHDGLQVVRDEISHLEHTLAALAVESAAVLQSDDLYLLREHAKAATQVLPIGRIGQDGHQESSGLEFSSGSYRILVGRSANENDYLLRHVARGNDIWLHVRDYPGAYVFVKHMPGKSIPLETLLDAGNLAVFYSKARTSGYAELYYTSVKYLRRPREGKKGLVLPTQEKNLSIRLEAERLERLQAGKSRE